MAKRQGKIFKVAGRPLLDSRAVLGIAEGREVVPRRDGWDVAVGGGSLRLRRVEGRAELPGQDGPLYHVDLRGSVGADALRGALAGLRLEPGGTFSAWPAPAVTACGSAGPACGCRACGRHPDSDDDAPDPDNDAQETW